MKNRFTIIYSFVAAILAGTLLFMLPVSSPAHTWMPFGDALFTACSAVCITGLTVIDPGTQLSYFGQIVLVTLVQLGCVGIMTLGTFFLVVAGRKLSFANEYLVSDAYGTSGVKGLRGLIVWVILSLLVFEILGAVGIQQSYGAASLPAATNAAPNWFRAYFYSVMAFCNAGFSLHPASLAPFGEHPGALAVMGVLTVLGGLGFLVIYNVLTIRFWRRNRLRRGKLTLHTRVVLVTSGVLLAVTFAIFALLEFNHALEPFAWSEKAAVAFFQAVTPRTCGFTVVPVTELQPATRFLSAVLMFIGAAPGGAGGGLKVTTFLVFVYALVCIYRGRHEVTVFRRTIPQDIVREALVIFFLFFLMVVFAMTLLLVSESGREGLTFETLLFETVSAVSTTGLSCGSTTSLLSGFGRAVIMLCMFTGRLGALSVVLLIAGRDEPTSIHFPKEEIVVG